MDNFVLTGANGSSLNVGSFVLYDPGVDFGEADLLKAAYAENPAAEGAVLAFETVNHRTMTFPLRLASTAAFSGVNGLQAWLRTLARPGATLDVQLEGVASSDAVRFDVLTGRLEADYDPRQYAQLDRLPATLKLDTQPFGYWPTMILLASSASVGGPGVLALNLGGSIFGDVPGLAELFIAPTSATSYGAVQKTDTVMWSFSAAASFQAWWTAASALMVGSNAQYIPTLFGDAFAPASQTIRYHLPSTGAGNDFMAAGWKNLVAWVIPPALEGAYHGKFRAYTWARLGPSQLLPFYVSADAQSGTVVSQAMGSAAPIATLPPALGTAALAGGQGASPAYSLLDLGEISLPQIASGGYETQIRIWVSMASTGGGPAATGLLDIAGLYLQPLDNAGMMARGLLQPTWTSPSALGRLYLSAVTTDRTISSPTSVVGSVGPISPAYHYRGVLPRVGASTLQLDLLLGGKQAQAGAPTGQPPLRSEPHYANVSVRYRPRFTFMKGL